MHTLLSSPVEAAQIQWIDVDLIDDHPWKPKLYVQGDVVDAIASSVKVKGFDPCYAVLVRPIANGRYQMISGHHRKRGCIQSGQQYIAALVRDEIMGNPFKEIALLLLDAYAAGVSNAFTLRLRDPLQEVHIAFDGDRFTGEYLEFPNIQWLSSWHNKKDLHAAFEMWNIPVCNEVFEWDVTLGATFFRAADIGMHHPSRQKRDRLKLPDPPIPTVEPDFEAYEGQDCIYFVQAVQLKLIKIGFSSNVEKRVAALSTACPDELKILKVVRGGQEVEGQIHKKFSRDRVRGEWFNPSEDLLSYIESLEG